MLHTTNLKVWTPQKVEGRDFASYYDKLRDMLVLNLGRDAQYLLSRPLAPNDSEQVRWTSELAGNPQNFEDMLGYDKDSFRKELRGWAQHLGAISLNYSLEQDNDKRVAGNMLASISLGISDIAAGVPQGQAAFRIDGHVVIAGWGGKMEPKYWLPGTDQFSMSILEEMDTLPSSLGLNTNARLELSETTNTQGITGRPKYKGLGRTIAIGMIAIVALLVAAQLIRPKSEDTTQVPIKISSKVNKSSVPDAAMLAYVKMGVETAENYTTRKTPKQNLFEAKGQFSAPRVPQGAFLARDAQSPASPKEINGTLDQKDVDTKTQRSDTTKNERSRSRKAAMNNND
jgi:hypothetical protein